MIARTATIIEDTIKTSAFLQGDDVDCGTNCVLSSFRQCTVLCGYSEGEGRMIWNVSLGTIFVSEWIVE
jgi:hypothetical protein